MQNEMEFDIRRDERRTDAKDRERNREGFLRGEEREIGGRGCWEFKNCGRNFDGLSLSFLGVQKLRPEFR